MEKDGSKTRLTRRGRIAVGAGVAILGLGSFYAQRALFNDGSSDCRRVGTEVVQSGDTIWSIVQSAEPNSDPRSAVDCTIKENDGLTAIQPGKILTVFVNG